MVFSSSIIDVVGKPEVIRTSNGEIHDFSRWQKNPLYTPVWPMKATIDPRKPIGGIGLVG